MLVRMGLYVTVGFWMFGVPVFSKDTGDIALLQTQIALLQHQNKMLQQRLDAVESKLTPALPTQPMETIIADGEKTPPKTPATPWISNVTSDGSTLTLNGQVNRALWFADNGRRSELKHLDNNESSTRLTFKADRPLNPETKLGTIIEGELGGNNTSNTDIGQQPTTTTLVARKLEGFVQTKWGELWFGQGETAAHRSADVDLSGTTVISEGAEFQAMTGGVRFIRGSFSENSNAAADRDHAIGDAYSDILGSSRKNRVRYITPAYHGLTASVSHATRDYSDVSIRYDGSLGGTQIAAAAGYANNPFNGKAQDAAKLGRRDYAGSFSALFPMGISIGGAMGGRHFDGPHRKEGTMWATRLGYQRGFFSFGKSALSLAYGQGRSLFDSTPGRNAAAYAEDNSEKINLMGAYFVQNIDPLWTEFYLGYQHHTLTRDRRDSVTGAALFPGYDFKDIHVAMCGARIRF